MHTSILDGLNDKQKQAVTLESKNNALILAGAGSGKTRVLTHKIAYLLQNTNINLNNVLAVTFTNKSAQEMKERLGDLLQQSVHQSWLGTFHGIAHRLLRLHSAQAKLNSNFQILDSSDQFRLIRRITKDLNIDEKKFPIKKLQMFINQQKDEGIRPEHIDAQYNYFIKIAIEVYQTYETTIQQLGVIDFAEILLRAHELLRDNPDLLQKYQQQFKHILVDEFQDTNRIQYAFIQLLHKDNTIFCVGDDDQSIYGWRGAQIENIQKLDRDFSPLTTIRLEQNYRSTGHILNASNALIANNSDRLGKSLWTDTGDGELIDYFSARSDIDEANFVVSQIKKYITTGTNPSDCAVLYRSNAQSRILEEHFIKQQIPYVIYGGLRFFERAEIKDALAYLRLTANPHDDIAFARVVNFPTRGIGNTTIEKIRNYAIENSLSLWDASKNIAPNFSARAKNSLVGFIDLIETITNDIQNLSLTEKIEKILEQSNLLNHFDTKETRTKYENLEELITAGEQYNHEDETMSEVMGFLSLTSLDSANENKTFTPSVQLMTIHSAKGLEFPFVFIVGLEEDLFPSRFSKDDPSMMNEERRLCYVAMTRAMRKLHLSQAEKRFMNGQTFFSYPSRFLNEVPKQHLNIIKSEQQSEINHNENYFSPAPKKSTSREYNIGDRVKHIKFGYGTITNLEGDGESARVEVNFKDFGQKWLICSYAKLEKV
ncbi:ATP-dependent DNA helicase UvrD/PcrA [hydrothermal vent metagenome]|uniref:DNA 3'-5' helicase n=1 Tax=hydrothermal vent metagenome TaxID=652676 RepID=A0A1W1BYX4_9ZZZZ